MCKYWFDLFDSNVLYVCVRLSQLRLQGQSVTYQVRTDWKGNLSTQCHHSKIYTGWVMVVVIVVSYYGLLGVTYLIRIPNSYRWRRLGTAWSPVKLHIYLSPYLLTLINNISASQICGIIRCVHSNVSCTPAFVNNWVNLEAPTPEWFWR